MTRIHFVHVAATLAALALFSMTTSTVHAAGGSGPVWGRDNCLYQPTGAGWARTNACRVLRSNAVWDVYDPTTRQWINRWDESHPQYIEITVLSGAARSTVLRIFRQGGTLSVRDRNGVWRNYNPAFEEQLRRQAANDAALGQVLGIINASQQRGVGIWVAPNCAASYNGCR